MRNYRVIPNVKHKMNVYTSAALTKIVGEKEYYKKILPPIGDILSTNTHLSRMNAIAKLVGNLKNADPEIREYAIDTLCKAYNKFPTAAKIHGPTKISMVRAEDKCLLDITGMTKQLPGGLNALFPYTKKRFPEEVLPHARVYSRIKPNDVSPEIQKALELHRKANPPK